MASTLTGVLHLVPQPKFHLKVPRSVQGKSHVHVTSSSSSSRKASLRSFTPCASAVESTLPAVHSVKDFLEDLKSAGRVRIIVNTGVGVLESVTKLDKLFYSQLPGKGEYANIMSKEDNVDFHLLVDKVSSAKLVQGKSMRGDIPTYMVRLFDGPGANVASLLVMWKPDTTGEYDDGQVEAFESLLRKYGEEVSFI